MLPIVISVCLINDPAVCRNERIPLVTSASPIQCAMQAEPYLAQWSGEHPGWRVVRWRCGGADEKDI